jgi:protein-S-isoprenylcysteine O-methyltransferase Ste14
VVYYFWIIAEFGVWYLAGRHKTGAVKKGDRGSVWIVFLGIFVAVGFAFIFRGAGLGLLPAWVEWPGLALMLLGIVLRSWSILLLGRFFSVRVEMQAGHQVVTAGPYRYIRHPAYTGSMITLAGMGLALGSWVGALLIVVIFRVVYSYRVRVEESFLLSSLGEEYRAYMEGTGRFVPRWPAFRRNRVG